MRRRRFIHFVSSLTLVAGALLAPTPVAASHPTNALLPDLGMAQLTDFSVQRRPKGVRWLRFSAVIVNVGQGPFQAYGYDRNAAGELKVDQEILTSDGGLVRHPTSAMMYWSGDGHGHWHVRDLEQYVLEGQNTGRIYGEKHGFCFWDNYRYNTTLAGYPLIAQYTSSNSCGTSSSNSTVRMGLSVGWGDKYPATIVDQYINITDLPAGEYTVTATADWAHWFVESNTANNSTTARIRLSKNGVTVLDPGTGP